MKRFVVAALLVSAPAMGARTSEILVTTTGVAMPTLSGRNGLEVYNYGPNALHCSYGAAISGNAFWVIPALSGTSPGYWASASRDYHKIFCVAVTADQVTGAATIINELD